MLKPAVAILLLKFVLVGQSYGVAVIVVTGPDGKPVQADVHLETPGDAKDIEKGKTDQNGRFQAKSLPLKPPEVKVIVFPADPKLDRKAMLISPKNDGEVVSIQLSWTLRSAP